MRRIPLVFPLAFPAAKFARVYVGDVAEAYLRCIEEQVGENQRYVLCGPRIYSLKELLRYTAKLSGRRRWILGLPRWGAWLQAA